jgi:hypothetical protein
MIFSLSDIIIAVTLLVNAIALLSSKVYTEPRLSKSESNSETAALVGGGAEGKQAEGPSISRFYRFLNWMRRLSSLIVLWNIFFIILMLLVFRS